MQNLQNKSFLMEDEETKEKTTNHLETEEKETEIQNKKALDSGFIKQWL